MIDEALSLAKTIPGDCGDEYRRPPFLTASGDLSHHLASFPKVYPAQPMPERPERLRIDTGSIWEPLAGYSRAVRVGDRILVSGTTATHGAGEIDRAGQCRQPDGLYPRQDPRPASRALGGSDGRRRAHPRLSARSELAGRRSRRCMAACFGHIRPANTLLEVSALSGTMTSRSMQRRSWRTDMAGRIDHLVWYCADLAEGQRRFFADRMDAAPVYGGVHPGEGTRNAWCRWATDLSGDPRSRSRSSRRAASSAEMRGLEGAGLYHWAVGGADLAALLRGPSRPPDSMASETGRGRARAAGRRLARLELLRPQQPRLRRAGAVLHRLGRQRASGDDRAARRLGSSKSRRSTPEAAEAARPSIAFSASTSDRAGCRCLGLATTLESAPAKHALPMFDPLPRGYVI